MPLGIYEHKPHSKETKEKIRQKLLGREFSEMRRKNISNALKGRKLSKEVKEKISRSNKGKSKKGHVAWNKGILCSEETKQKISKTLLNGQFVGEKNHFWKGGVSFGSYSLKFNGRLRKEIRQRDNFECQLCGISENGRAHDIHHINYDKKDCKERNLITLCHSHNAIANTDREEWQFLFETLQEIRGI